MEDDDPDHQSPHDNSIEAEKLSKQLAALDSFISACDSNRKISTTTSYKNLSHRVKMRYVNLVKFITRSAASLIASSDSDMLMHDSFNDVNNDDSSIVLDGNFRQIMSGVSEAYINAESWQSRREILSILAPKLSLKLMQSSVPGITKGRFSSPRLHARKYGVGSKVEVTTKVVQRFDDCQIAHFVDFIVSPHVCTDLPFGEKVLKLSSGVELFIPNTIRNMGPTRIVDQYLFYCKEMCSDFEPLGKISLFTILEICKASTRKSLQGINYFAAEGGEAFDGIKKLIEDKAALSMDSERLIENLKRARFYLKSDYKVHVRRSSDIADHCCAYALSDLKGQNFVQDCDHEHDQSCIECSNLSNTLNETERFIKQTETDEELLDRAVKKFQSYRESIEAWKAHLLRSINQDLCRENLLNKLSNDEIYLNLDWAMKFLPVKSRQPQSEFFDKRGISWHITVVMKNDESFDKEDSVFDEDGDALDDSQQTSDQAMSDFSIENEEDTNDIIKEGGKGPCDRYAAVIKSNVRRYLNENHNVTNASEFVAACQSYKGIKGVTAFDCRIEKSPFKKRSKCNIKQITNYFNFEYQNGGLLVHRSWNIGSGLLIPWSQLNYDKSILNITSSEITSCVPDWVQTKGKSSTEIMEVEDSDLQEEESVKACFKEASIYECDVEVGCTAEFIKFGNYINHILIGNHNRTVEKFSLKDSVMKIYHTKLDEIENRHIVSMDMSLTEAIADETNILSKDWALPIRKPKKEFSDKQQGYLRENFDEGISSVRHWKPKEVILDMETLKEKGKFYFAASDILSESLSKNDDEDEETDSEMEALEEDFQDIENAVEEITVLENFSTRAKIAPQ
ncbi:unnamed protein product [Rotaria magnacalcarata]|uniref:Uncharacterized protein n=2 Tax=Rotaria magnacalcarata TaxID=392030 RepID=A0A816SDA1_9BILA|nr:unnamed protein product [Rotaria magnacalcarata]